MFYLTTIDTDNNQYIYY